MKNTFHSFRFLAVLFLIIYNCSPAKGQIISGTILDAKAKTPITYATVYVNGSFVATYSDQEGRFELDITGYASMPVIISALGYYSITLTSLEEGKNLNIYLKPKVFELNEIIVTANGGKKSRRIRERNLREFKSIFIGETTNSKKCEILNEDDIRFQFTRDGDTMKVYANKPIIIANNALGYTVTYFLDRFDYCESDKLLDMTGNILFKEDMSKKTREKKMFEKRRVRAYMGSRMHFFRALYGNNLSDEGFTMRDTLRVLSYEEATGLKDTTRSDDQLKIILYKRMIPEGYYVNHTSKVMSSFILLRKEFVIFKRNGYYDGTAVIWEGEMAKQRIGDWLPYEYKPEL